MTREEAIDIIKKICNTYMYVYEERQFLVE